MNASRISPLAAVLLCAAPLAAQPAPPPPDAPLAQHADYLVRQGPTSFEALKAPGTAGETVPSTHRIRMGGHDLRSTVGSFGWLARHLTVLHAEPGTQDSVYRAAVEALRGEAPAGWTEHSWRPQQYVRWRECSPDLGYVGRFVRVFRVHADRADGSEVHLEVISRRTPCPRPAGRT